MLLRTLFLVVFVFNLYVYIKEGLLKSVHIHKICTDPNFNDFVSCNPMIS